MNVRRRRFRSLAVAALLALGLTSVAIDAPAPTRRGDLDHVGAYNFMVEISGVSAGYFKGVDGLSAELEVIAYQDGNDLILRKRPGRTKVTLRGGYLPNKKLAGLLDKPKKNLSLPIVHRPDTQKLKATKLCQYSLRGARVVDVRSRKVKKGKDVFTVQDVTLMVDEQSHNCAKYFKHPSKR